MDDMSTFYLKTKDNSNNLNDLLKIQNYIFSNFGLESSIVKREYVNALQSAKPGQAHIPVSPCPADTHSTGRHPGANDGGVKYCKMNMRDMCQAEVITGCETCGHYVRKHKSVRMYDLSKERPGFGMTWHSSEELE